jgi:hypothetical protein
LKTYRSRGDKGNGKRQILLILVLPRRDVLPYLVILELGRELVVGDALFERLTLPPYLPGGGIPIELLDLRCDEK